MRIAVTGATGQLGSLLLDRALEAAPANLVGVVRNPEKGAGFAARDVAIKHTRPRSKKP